ncbi:hypothetical protein RclHR1_02320005 [Rhizophagus clarus]|uniref:Zinc finger protein 862-like n=1 Tax=Rhizophagus clarus TaxID=94130 RepID=A0A2Z6QW92_9GLOM|nr:hypothetical protein RclHR1_02320005 [Rhizophagus clarus]GES85876.1 zinc finger protein 862-like [Rhizophagus clarus]
MDEIDDNESSDIDSDLEETHTELPNGFQKECLEFYKWLIYDESKNLMFYSLCQSHKKLNKFEREGSRNFKTSALSEHASTKDHTDATNLEIARAEFIKVSNNSVDKAQNYVGALMKIIFWMAENDILLNKLSEVVKLCRIIECPQLISAFNTITYENNVSGRKYYLLFQNQLKKRFGKH